MSSIFSTYSQGENRVTSTIIQVLKHLPVNVVERFLAMLSESDTNVFIEFNNQPKYTDSNSVPDAEISANFQLFFETKIEKNVDLKNQMENHLALVEKRKIEKKKTKLIYLTPDQSRPESLKEQSIIWKNFQHLHYLISELMDDDFLVLSERDQFLLRNLQEFFEDEGLLPTIDEVLIVPARIAWPAYKKHGVYVCQANRSFRNVSLIGFYAEGEIKPRIAKIRKRIESVDFSERPVTSDNLLNQKLHVWLEDDDNNQHKNTRLQVFDLTEFGDTDTETLKKPIPNDLKNKSGRGYAYTQGQRYTSLSKLKDAKTTSDL